LRLPFVPFPRSDVQRTDDGGRRAEDSREAELVFVFLK